MDLRRVYSGDGPVAYWRPVDGARHAMLPTERPHPGQQRKSLCGEDITITKASPEDWLAPTCAACWDAARTRGDEAAQRNAPAVRPRTK
ncbi:hypothetical protein OOZ19_11425 [Saccharopolyspora sp. NFXS83]|uniref:zinc finger protein n=1 Tax=Saccharopolyspora sp. NFXS83 TaxID=2993560 RepID=UPI00224B5F9D|nr:zinc finger protein [Saccharopolyspora sp. NFXS83]MCX2730851.1 hypothetical protein [Saccharopolyspora sp. NFXS83]